MLGYTSIRLFRDATIAIAIAYQLAIIVYPIHGALEFYYFHLGLVLAVVGLSLLTEWSASDASPKARLGRWPLIAVLIIGLAATAYLHLIVGELELRQPFITRTDFIAGFCVLAAVIVLVYLVWGSVLAGLIFLSTLYFAFGDLLPGAFNYESPSSDVIMSYLAGMGGARGVLWGIPVSANTLFLIILFGGLLKGTRILDMFNEIGKLLLSVSRGGICYSSILASSAIGMVTGQAVANVALSGPVTITSMKQRGLSGAAAGAVEVVSSLGSQLIPPIMGLGGFLIAVNLGVPYVEVAAAAIIPAFLFVLTVFIAAYFLAEATPGLERSNEPVDVTGILWTLPSFLISFGALVTLLYLRYSAGYAAFWALGLLLTLSFLRPARYRPSWTELWAGATYGTISALQLGLIMAGIGILVQVLITTGAGFELGRTIMVAAGDNVALGLLLGMVLSMLIGLGLPTPAAYALIAIVMIPFLIDLGVPAMAAHFFGFYFAIFSAVTPPVAVGVLAATRISGAGFYATVREAARMSLVAILIPYTFVVFPSILAFPDVGLRATFACLSLMAAIVMWGAAIYGVMGRPLRRIERLALLLGPALHCAYLATQWVLVAAIVIAAAIVLILRTWQEQRRKEVGSSPVALGPYSISKPSSLKP